MPTDEGNVDFVKYASVEKNYYVDKCYCRWLEIVDRMKIESKKNNFVPSDVYGEIIKLLPIVSVESFIIMDNALLFLRRKVSLLKVNGGFLA